jgi:hypothetical protein
MTYDVLVERINNNFSAGDKYHSMFEQKTGPEMQEVNAWTYWQGLNVRHPRIMVVGQDWGSSQSGLPYFKAIDEMIANSDHSDMVSYFKYVTDTQKKSRNFKTDLNLIEYFKLLGDYAIDKKRYPDLFFTNLIPGYRKTVKSTRGFKAGWVTEQVKNDFKDLISILRPQAALCLGKNTFQQVALIYGNRGVMGGKKWNDYLDYLNDNCDPLPINKESNTPSYVFALPHPGYYGTLNRGNENSKNDWKRVKKWLDAHPISGTSDGSHKND